MAINTKLLRTAIYFCLFVNEQSKVLSKPATGDISINIELNDIKGENDIDNNVNLSINDGEPLSKDGESLSQTNQSNCEDCNNNTTANCTEASQNDDEIPPQPQGKLPYLN